MKFGVFYEMQLPRPWMAGDEATLFNNALDQVEMADRLGYDHVWVVEHHFLEEYSHSSAPEVFLGAASQRTSRIRLGHGIAHLTTEHPARVAERAATLDLLSGGRVELGLGEGSTGIELRPFGRRYDEKRAVWEEAVACMVPMFGSERHTFSGQYFDFPTRNVVPKPVQKPHPPLWVACSQIDTIEMAARRGLGALGFQFVLGTAAASWVQHYYQTFMSDRHLLADYQPNPNIALVAGFMCAPTDEEARARADGWTFFQFAIGYYAAIAADTNGHFDRPDVDSIWERYLEWRTTPAGEKAAQARGLIGSPATLRERLREWEHTNVDQIILLNQAGKCTDADIRDSLKLFAEEVMPEFQDREASHQEWKARVLSGELTLDPVDIAPLLPAARKAQAAVTRTGTPGRVSA